jgi:hypothetical protein
VMMAVIFFCLRPPAPANGEGRVHKRPTSWQLGSYIWVPPPKYPQDLG